MSDLTWMYHPKTGPKLFESTEDAVASQKEGYFDTPAKFSEAEKMVPVEDVLKASDAAVKLASENDIDLKTVTGTGADGNITVNDVKAAIAAKAA